MISCVGVMFAPHHQAAADEMLRVTAPGGTIAILAWTPEGFIGQMFATMKPYAPAPPPGASPPPLWGSEGHVRGLFGDGVRELRFVKEHAQILGLGSGAQFRDFFKANYGPTIAVYGSLADQPDRAAELDTALAELGDRCLEGGEMVWEYLLVTATRT